MAKIRPETEVDRTAASLERLGADLPLVSGTVAIEVSSEAASSSVGQRLLVTLINQLARMKGIVSDIAVRGVLSVDVQPAVPLDAGTLDAGIDALVASLNSERSVFRASVHFGPSNAAVRVGIGSIGDADIVLGADGWRALIGREATKSSWRDRPPYGAALAAAVGAAEVFKRLLIANGISDPQRHLVRDLVYSAFNHGIGPEAAKGPDISELRIGDMAVVGCGAGGSAALLVLAMQPGLAGHVALIEPGRHKLSNLNRYLMTSVSDVHEGRHKLGSVINHLARFAPSLRPTTYATSWEQLDDRPWPLLLSTVDTIPARWAIQRRARPGAEIIDAAVDDLLYTVLHVAPGGWCLECKHPYDPDHDAKQRAGRWGTTLSKVREWTNKNVVVNEAMIAKLAETQGTPIETYVELIGKSFDQVPALTECGETKLRTDVPSQSAVLPLATTAAGVILAAEVTKYFVAPEFGLSNWLGHDLGRRPERPRVVFRPASRLCPNHQDGV